ncbi:dihydroxyacetone kinase subunit DhaK [Nocardiopsis mangrovi]|uniref:Dihydroxyacetone kinase subunit DhaK n=1 Tax=Nocardiopsis mangrovi TaxID=1179818 RepID=A0ABV9DU54_9ACTN
MRKLINAPDDFVDEYLAGILAAHPGALRAVSGDGRALARADAPVPGRVGIVTGGGSGHLPVFLGYVGRGLATAAAVGNVFSAQSGDAAEAAVRAADSGAGVLCLYGNYTGDRLNFDLACDLAADDGITTRTVRFTDDAASAPPERAAERRGVAGLFFGYKCAGAAAERGDPLDAVTAIAARTNAATRSAGVGLAPTIIPATGRPTFTLEPGEMEIGIGIHGEPGIRRGPLQPADAVADQLLDTVAPELDLARGDRVAVLVNGLGATSREELYILFRRVAARLGDLGVGVHRTWVGEYATSMEMAGASLSLLKLDDELAGLLDAPASSPFFREGP